MHFQPTEIPDVILIKPQVFKDERGFFQETYQKSRFAEMGITADFVQDNHSGSRKNILRGLHYQIQNTQGKLVRAIKGEIYDVAVDIRRSSPTFKQWVGVRLSAERHEQLWVPPGFAHGFLTLSDWVEIIYKTTDIYAPQHERTLLWNDPAVGVIWPLSEGFAPEMSAKDMQGKLLSDLDLFD